MSLIKIYNVDAWQHIAGMTADSVECVITDPDYKLQMTDVMMQELRRVCSGHIVMFSAPENPFFKPDEQAYWIKETRTTNVSKHLARFVEIILIERHGTFFNADLDWPNYSGVYYDRLLEKRTHEFQKPKSLMERLVAIYCPPGGTVLDPFFGSGTTLVAAQSLGMNAVGCEINTDHFDRFWRSQR